MATADENLRSQFQLLQDQQQKKLMRRKQRKEEQRAKTASVVSSTANSAFGVTDELGLKLAEPNNKSYVSEELVDHLNEQIRELKDENGRVYKLLSERDFELRNLKKKREEEKAALAATGGPVTNETAGTKIVELSKKVRELNAELESEKNKCRQLNKKCQDLNRQVTSANSADNKSIRASTISLRSSIDEKPEDPNEIKILQDKLRQMESKMIDFRNSNSALKQELRIINKAFSQEVGENVNIQTCLNSTSNWRGRAQQIIQLQQKNEELKKEIQTLQGVRGDTGLEAEMMGFKKRSAVERHKDQLKKLEKDKKEAQGKMAAEKEALEEENFALKHKLDVSKTRNQVLSSEIKNLKKQLPELLQKNEHDNELIEALMKEQNRLKVQLEEAQKNQHNIKLEQQSKLNEINAKEQHEKNVIEQLKVIVSDKESKVKVLENEIQQLKLAHLQRAQANKLFAPGPGGNVSVMSHQTPVPVQHNVIDSRPSTGFETIDLQYQVETPQPDSTVTYRVTAETPTFTLETNVPPDMPKPPSRGLSRSNSRNNRPHSGGRPPSVVRPTSASKPVDQQLLADLQYQCQEYRTVAQVAEVERDKLMELMQVLQRRLDESSQKIQDCQKDLVEQKKKNVMLEKQVAKSNLNSGGTSRSAGGMSARKKSGMTASVTSMPTMMEEDNPDNMSLEELVVNLEIQRDENEALKTALRTTLKAKEEDMKVYSDTIEETKIVFLQALRQYKQTVHGT